MNREELIREANKAFAHKETLQQLVSQYQKIVILGNGGSNSVASHIAQDYTKQLGKHAVSFSDPSRLTCYINDYGMKEANKQFLKEFADQETLVLIISSSGDSANMVTCVQYCMDKHIPFGILTGFEQWNIMRSLCNSRGGARVDIWVDSRDYGVVECVHQIALHSIIGN